jgi:NitT/TauT family transport system substrate-binding protein
MKSRLFQSILIFLLCVLITACTRASQPLAKHPGTGIAPLSVSYLLWSGSFPIVIAQEKGFFAQQGVQVKATLNDSPTATDQLIAAFSGGKSGGALMPLGDAISVSVNNPQTRIVAIVDTSDGADAIIAQPEIKTIADLKGKRIGTKLGSFSEMFVIEALKANGLTPDDVMLTNTPAEQIVDRLQSQELQAGHTWEPFVSESKMQQKRVIFTSHQTPDLIPDILLFSEDVLRDRPQDVRAFIRAWFQAVEYWKANPKEGSALIARTLKLDPTSVSWEGIRLLNHQDNLQAFQPGETATAIRHIAERYNDFFGQTGSLRKPANIDKIFDSAFLGD